MSKRDSVEGHVAAKFACADNKNAASVDRIPFEAAFEAAEDPIIPVDGSA